MESQLQCVQGLIQDSDFEGAISEGSENICEKGKRFIRIGFERKSRLSSLYRNNSVNICIFLNLFDYVLS